MAGLHEVFLQTPEELSKYISLRFAPQDISSSVVSRGELTLTVIRSVLLKLMQFLRDDSSCRFVRLTDITCADYPERSERFEIVYHLHSLRHNRRIRVKLMTDGDCRSVRFAGCIRRLFGMNARYGICSAPYFRIIPTCAVF